MQGKTTKKTKELNNSIIELFKQGISKQKIAEQLHVAVKYVREYLKKQNITKSAWDYRIDSNLIIDLIKEGKNLKEISKITGFPLSAISKVVKNNNLEYYIHRSFNENIFEKIDTEEKAYWLGFIYADGNVSGNSLGIALSEQDLNHLHKFSMFMECKTDYIHHKKMYNKKYDKTYYACCLSLTNQKLISDLKNCGVYPNKSFTLQFPDNNIIPTHLIPHFIRGYFDGDGSIMSLETSKIKLAVSIIGNKSFMDKFSKFVNYSNYREHKVKNGCMYYLDFKILKSIKFCEYIYKNATIYLDRKKKI